MDQFILFHELNKKKWVKKIDYLIPQTKHTISERDMVWGAFLKLLYSPE